MVSSLRNPFKRDKITPFISPTNTKPFKHTWYCLCSLLSVGEFEEIDFCSFFDLRCTRKDVKEDE